MLFTLAKCFTGIKDVAQNENVNAQTFLLSETDDNVAPKVESGTLEYSTGLVKIKFSEVLDLSPLYYIDNKQMRLLNATADALSPPLETRSFHSTNLFELIVFFFYMLATCSTTISSADSLAHLVTMKQPVTTQYHLQI